MLPPAIGSWARSAWWLRCRHSPHWTTLLIRTRFVASVGSKADLLPEASKRLEARTGLTRANRTCWHPGGAEKLRASSVGKSQVIGVVDDAAGVGVFHIHADRVAFVQGLPLRLL